MTASIHACSRKLSKTYQGFPLRPATPSFCTCDLTKGPSWSAEHSTRLDSSSSKSPESPLRLSLLIDVLNCEQHRKTCPSESQKSGGLLCCQPNCAVVCLHMKCPSGFIAPSCYECQLLSTQAATQELRSLQHVDKPVVVVIVIHFVLSRLHQRTH